MSETLLLAILSISELALVTTALAVYLLVRNRRLAEEITEGAEPAEAPSAEAQPPIQFADYLRQNLEQTQAKLGDLPQEHQRLMEARLGFLQNEINAQARAQNPQAYWQALIQGLNTLLPATAAPAEVSAPNAAPKLSELDDIDIGGSSDIPTLQAAGSGVRRDPSITIETANEDLERMRKIISRQHESMDELKKSLQQKSGNLENNQELSKKLEEVEVAQAQLNMCVETLEKENERLNELLKSQGDSPSQEEFEQARQELEQANERITTLEKENSEQAVRIMELETEIAELEKALEQRNEELARVQHEEADLSQTEAEEHSQDSLMKEIESLTELITKKSEELSKLQSETADFDLNAEFDANAGIRSA